MFYKVNKDVKGGSRVINDLVRGYCVDALNIVIRDESDVMVLVRNAVSSAELELHVWVVYASFKLR